MAKILFFFILHTVRGVAECGICREELDTARCLERFGEGGWGHVPCCNATFHYACLSHWLRLTGADAEVESSRGMVPLEHSGCPMCRRPLSRSLGRMLGDGSARAT